MNDAFDDALISVADVQVREDDTGNSYGVSNPTFSTVATAVPCVVTGFGRKTGEERRANTKFALGYRLVLMRPWPNGEGTPNTLTHEHWLSIDGQQHDIVSILDPGNQHHHIEVETRIVFA